MVRQACMMSPDNSRGARLFRALLGLYPAAFRDEYGREMRLLFADRYRDASGVRDRATLWLDVLTGLAIEAPKEHARMIRQDLRAAFRSLRKQGLVTFTIVITLGLGIGANASMFSLVNAVVLRTLPVPTPDGLFVVRAAPPLSSNNRFSGPMVERLRQIAPPDAGVAAMSRVARAYTRTDAAAEIEPAALQLVSSSYFPVLGLRPAFGQPLPAETGFTPMPVAMISHRYWQRRFAGRADVLGRTIVVNGVSYTIVGVAPRGFSGVWLESPVDIWVPLTMDRAVKYSQNYSADGANFSLPWLSQPRIWWLDVIVRTSPERAATVASVLNSGVQDMATPDARIVLEPFANGFSAFRGRFATPLLALIAMAALVLLVACANVANLLLARAAVRQREMAIRMSLGAGRARLVHQLFTESVLLIVMAGAAALLFARWSSDLLVRTATASSAGAPFSTGLDLPVWAFTAAVALTSVVLFGLIPAWRTARVDVAAAIKAGSRGTSGTSTTRPARLLVVIQVGLSLVLVAGTGLLVRSFQNMLNVDLGFDSAHLLSVTFDPKLASGKPEDATPEAIAALQQRVLDSVASVPGVTSASLAMCGMHTSCSAREDGFQIDGYEPGPKEQVVFLVNAVGPGYFSTVGMRLIAGRTFSDRDVTRAPKVAIVNRTLAEKYFRNGDGLGRRFGFQVKDIEIVGVVEDARLTSVKDAAVPTAYFPIAQRPTGARSLEVRSSGDPRQMIGAVRAAVRAVPGVPLESIVPIEERIDTNLSEPRVIAFLASGFGALALGLAGFGLFGLLSYAVARRGSEFGIRMALGATRSRILGSVVREAFWLVLCGILLGIPFAIFGSRLISSMFFGLDPDDWSNFVIAAVPLVAVAAGCSILPALRASRVDPLAALREE
jgi:putative ABC transport system permease protein